MPDLRGTPGLLALVLATAFLHALFEARSRPLYQVADEMAYLRSAQVVALAGSPGTLRGCIAPPDGQLLDVGEGGKRGFRFATGHQLRLLCELSGGPLPLFALRACQAMSLPLIALAAWYLAGVLTGRADAGIVAALIVAVHPVAASVSGGVTPDAWANAFAAGAFVAATRLALARDRWWDPWLLGVCILGGLLWKDTATAMAALVPAVIGVRVLGHLRGRAGVGRLAGLQIAGALVVGAVAISLLWAGLRTPYQGAPGTLGRLLAAPWDSAVRVATDAASHASGFIASSLLSLYRPLVYVYPTGDQPVTPAYATMLFVLIAVAALAGGVLSLMRGEVEHHRTRRRVYAVWLTAAVLCFLQPAFRHLIINQEDMYQGRWLFPLLAPAAAVTAAWLSQLFGRRLIPLLTVACVISLWIVVVDVVRHYYVAYPLRLSRAVLFTRPTGDHDIGDARVLQLIEQVTASQSPVWTWGILVLLVVTSFGLTVSAIGHASRDTPHV